METRRFFAAAAVLAAVYLLPGGATAYGDEHRNQPGPGGAPVWPEDTQAQNTVFPRHNGHIMPPSPEDWARCHAAEAGVQESRPLFPCCSYRGGHKRHRR